MCKILYEEPFKKPFVCCRRMCKLHSVLTCQVLMAERGLNGDEKRGRSRPNPDFFFSDAGTQCIIAVSRRNWVVNLEPKMTEMLLRSC